MEDVACIDEATHAHMTGTAVKAGDLLLNITGGSIGRCCCIPPDFTEANVSQHVAILRPAISGMQGFLHALIRSPYFQSFVINEQTGAGRGGLPKTAWTVLRLHFLLLPNSIASLQDSMN